MRVLVACEESQAVTIELRKLGVEAYSCDILDCSGGHPEWHLKQDVTSLLQQPWDMVIGFPPCTYLTITGNRWFNVEKYGNRAIERERKTGRKQYHSSSPSTMQTLHISQLKTLLVSCPPNSGSLTKSLNPISSVIRLKRKLACGCITFHVWSLPMWLKFLQGVSLIQVGQWLTGTLIVME